MTEKKPTLLIALSNDLYVRNFVQSGAFDGLEKKFNICYATSSTMQNQIIHRNGMVRAGTIKETPVRVRIRLHLREITMMRFRERSITWKLKQEGYPPKIRFVYSIFAKPYLFNFLYSLFELLLGTNEYVDEILRRVQPEWIVIPNMCNDSLAVDVVKSANRFGVKSCILINGWDNLSGKGTIPFLPTFIGVWGAQDVEHASRIHALPPERTKIVGAPHLQQYFRSPTLDRKQFLAMQGIDAQKRVLLFAGCILQYDEMAVLRELDSAIENGDIPNAHILYRPHPWRHPREHERSYFDHDFKHVTVDFQVRETFYRSQREGRSIGPDEFLPELDYYPSLMNAIDLIVSPLSTTIVEAGCVGKPALVLAFSDGQHKFSADRYIKYEHLQKIPTFPGVVVCYDRSELISSMRAAQKIIDNPAVSEQHRRAIEYIVRLDEKSYCQRLVEALAEADQEVLRAYSPSPNKVLADPSSHGVLNCAPDHRSHSRL